MGISPNIIAPNTCIQNTEIGESKSMSKRSKSGIRIIPKPVQVQRMVTHANNGEFMWKICIRICSRINPVKVQEHRLSKVPSRLRKRNSWLISVVDDFLKRGLYKNAM